MNEIKALFFDVFGTTVDWRSTVTQHLYSQAQKAVERAKSNNKSSSHADDRASAMSEEDWGNFAQKWRESYYAFTRRIAASPGEAPYKTIDEHHLDSLKELLESWNLSGLWTDAEVQDLSLIWHRLNPWPDTVQGIRALNTRFQTSTLSNGNIRLLTDMADYARLEWTHVMSAEMFQSYKPNPKVYLGAAEKLGLRPSECGMVAAHMGDLNAARKCGFKTIYVDREQEETWDADKISSVRQEGWVDVWIDKDDDGFLSAAKKLGV